MKQNDVMLTAFTELPTIFKIVQVCRTAVSCKKNHTGTGVNECLMTTSKGRLSECMVSPFLNWWISGWINPWVQHAHLI